MKRPRSHPGSAPGSAPGLAVAALATAALQHLQAGRLDEAEQALRRILGPHPDDPDATHLLGLVALQRRDLASAAELLRRATRLDPAQPAAWNNYGAVLREQGELGEAVAAYRKALAVAPDFTDALCNLGGALNRLGREAEALPALRRAIALEPNHAEALNNLASALLKRDALSEAEAMLRRALAAAPRMAEAWNNLGNLLARKGIYEEAASVYRTALKHQPRHAEAAANLGIALYALKRTEDALAALRDALALRPGYDYAEAALLQILQAVCDWDGVDALSPKLDAATQRALHEGRRPDESPFLNVSRCDDVATNFAVAKAWAQAIGRHGSDSPRPRATRAETDGAPIVLGYLSSDLGEHAIGHLMRGQFRLHDRDRFRVHIYSTRLKEGSAHDRQVTADSDRHVHVDGLEPTQIAEAIRRDHVDVLIHVNGWTKHHNLAACALRPAPVQVEHLGFPGTTGASYIDYAIVDPIVVPSPQAEFFAEKLIYLPHCYQSNDNRQAISERAMSRAEWNLPDDGVVFASFNQSYKFDRAMFGVWMALLADVSGSVLWLLGYDAVTEANLRNEADRHGIDPRRLVFSPLVSKSDHLRRIQLADLCLDTRIYTGHTTTSDALWAGVPVVALRGRHFASLVSASCLTAMGMTDLVVDSLETYKELALRLARDGEARAALRRRITENRQTFPLFDTTRFVRDLERAYAEIWRIHCAGESPRQIVLSG